MAIIIKDGKYFNTETGKYQDSLVSDTTSTISQGANIAGAALAPLTGGASVPISQGIGLVANAVGAGLDAAEIEKEKKKEAERQAKLDQMDEMKFGQNMRLADTENMRRGYNVTSDIVGSALKNKRAVRAALVGR